MMPDIEQNTEHCGVKYQELTCLWPLSGVIFMSDGFSHEFLYRLGRQATDKGKYMNSFLSELNIFSY